MNQNHEDFINRMKGLTLRGINCVCEMIMLDFEGYAFHALNLTRVIKNNEILFTTYDYQSWDEENDKHNDEWYHLEKYRDEIIGGTVTDIVISPLNDIRICFDNDLIIECYIANGYPHYEDEQEQWVFFEKNSGDETFLTVYQKRAELSVLKAEDRKCRKRK